MAVSTSALSPSRMQCLMLIFSLLLSSSRGFFSKAARLPRPSPSPSVTVTKYHNETVRKNGNVDRDRMLKSQQSDEEKAQALKSRDATSPAARARQVLKLIGRILYAVKASCAVAAIQVVLSLRLERAVLQRLPLNVLMFLLEVSMNRPEVLHSVAREVGERISQEVCTFTGKEKYQVGDITKTIVARYTGNEDYKFGDLTRATVSKFSLKRKLQSTSTKKTEDEVVSFASRFQRKVERNRKQEAPSDEIVSMLFKVTGKKEYEFGDVTKAVIGKMRNKD